jgi:ribosomal protein L44E
MPFKDKAKQLESGRRHYARNSERIKARVAENNKLIRHRNKEYVDGVKANMPCEDCGIVYAPYVMQFDHILEGKRGAIANLVREGVSIQVLQTEIDKCELVCANCHSERTHSRKVESEEFFDED